MEAGVRALKRSEQVRYVEKLTREGKIRCEHTLHDSVLVHILGAPTGPYKPDPYPYTEEERVCPVIATIVEKGADFPSSALVTQLRLVLE